MTKIIIAGAGVGGLVCAQRLVKKGYEIILFEAKARNELSYAWYDDIRFDVFEKTDIEPPAREFYEQKSKWVFVSPDQQNRIPVPPAKPMEEVSISRRALTDYLMSLVEKNIQTHFETAVESLIIEDNFVKGVKAGGKEYLADLVIDCTGMRSPLRAQANISPQIPADADKNGIMYGYRAFYKRAENSEAPTIASTLYLKHQDSVGISWCNLNPRNEVDVLIGRIGTPLTDEIISEALADLRRGNPILSEELVRPAVQTTIAVSAPLSCIVTNGYVLLGDSAYMTMPIMGSGIESSMKAGKILAEVITDEQLTHFSAVELWEYQEEFFDEFGEDYVFIDVMKRWLLDLPPADINWVFGAGLVTDEDLAIISTDGGKLKVSSILKKVGILFKRFDIVRAALKQLRVALKAKKHVGKLPEKYDAEKFAKWQAKYEGFFK